MSESKDLYFMEFFHLIQVFLFLIKPAYHFCFYQKTGGKMSFKDYLFTKYSSYHTRKV